MHLCNSLSDECYTIVFSGNVFRGCIGDDIVREKESCGPDNCLACSDRQGCNDVKLESQECYFATNRTEFTTITCPTTLKPMGCYHEIDNELGTFKKGCVSTLPTVPRANCKKNGDKCKVCSGPYCNNREHFVQCISCSSQMTPSCVSGASENKTCKSYFDMCYTFIEGSSVQRGCRYDTTEGFTNEHMQYNLEKLEYCYSYNDIPCNKNRIRDSCIVCNSNSNPNCRDKPELIDEQYCSLRSSDSMGCYLKESNGLITRGCIKHLNRVDRWACVNSSSESCQHCLGQNCNQKVDFEQECYLCDGSVDERCTVLGLTNKTMECSSYASTCLVGIDVNGFTRRRCSINNSFDRLEFPYGMELCYKNLCNFKIFPEKRRRCFQCSGSDSCLNLKTEYGSDMKPKVCNNYAKQDKCFIYTDGKQTISIFEKVFFFNKFPFPGDQVHRGCMSDRSDARSLCKENKENCDKCKSNGCNNATITIESSAATLCNSNIVLILLIPIFSYVIRHF